MFLTSRLGALAGDMSTELPVRPASHGGDPGQAAAMEEAAPGRTRGGGAWVSCAVMHVGEGRSGALTCLAGPEVCRRPAGRSSSHIAQSCGGSGMSGSGASRPEPGAPAQPGRPRPTP